MKLINKLNKWTNSHNPFYVLDVMRWFLGGFLFLKGVDFMTDTQYLKELIAPNSEFLAPIFIIHYVALAHISGGILIALGFLTRIAIAIQIPILIGALAVNFLISMNPGNLSEASFILLLSLFFVIVGSGNHSVDYSLKMGI